MFSLSAMTERPVQDLGDPVLHQHHPERLLVPQPRATRPQRLMFSIFIQNGGMLRAARQHGAVSQVTEGLTVS